MAQFFLRTKREAGESPLYTKIRRNGMQMYICTGIRVDIQEWNKAQRSLAAMRRYENTEEGAKVHDLQMKVTKAIDTLYAENKINTNLWILSACHYSVLFITDSRLPIIGVAPYLPLR